MTRLRLIAVFLFLSAALSTHMVRAQEVRDGLIWYTDINQAYEQSLKSHKPVFAFFTGSDWCGWCHRLQNNVYSKAHFKEWAKNNVVLLELDFPRNKKLPDALAQQNAGLQQFFNVQGFPTVWMFFMEKDKTTSKFNIAPLGSLGYPESAPGHEEEAFLANAAAVMKNKKEAKKAHTYKGLGSNSDLCARDEHRLIGLND